MTTTRTRRTDAEILRDIAARHGFTTEDELRAFKGTSAYQLALFNERLGDLGWALIDPVMAIWRKLR